MQRRLLIVEPDLLTRWSLQTYFGRWFEVRTAAEANQGSRVVERWPVDALIVADDLSPAGARDIEATARRGNPAVRVLHTIARTADDAPPPDPSYVEKPFDLRRLADLLGVSVAPDTDNGYAAP